MVRFRTSTWLEYTGMARKNKAESKTEREEGEEGGESEKASNQTTMYRLRSRAMVSVVDVVRHRQAILIRGVPDV